MGHGHRSRHSYGNGSHDGRYDGSRQPADGRYRGRSDGDDGYGNGYGRPPQPRGSLPWIAILIGLAVWSGVVYLGYAVVDWILSWLSSNSGNILQSGVDAGTALGVGREVGTAVDGLQNIGIIDWVLGLLRAILGPAAAVIWVLGALVIALLPRLWRRFGGQLRAWARN